MRSGLKNAAVNVEPGGDVSERGTSCVEIAGTTKQAGFSMAGRMPARFTLLVVADASANSASQSETGLDDTTNPDPATAS